MFSVWVKKNFFLIKKVKFNELFNLISSIIHELNEILYSLNLLPKKNKNRKLKSEWVFGIYNLYNRDNASSILFRKNDETLRNEAVQISIFGIVPSVTYNFNF